MQCVYAIFTNSIKYNSHQTLSRLYDMTKIWQNKYRVMKNNSIIVDNKYIKINKEIAFVDLCIK